MIAEIPHTFDTLRNTFTFLAGPLERNTHSPTPRLAHNTQNSVVDAYENALSELLTKWDAVESFGFRVVRDARKELVVKIEKELEELEKKVMAALRIAEVDEKVEKPVVRMEVAPVEAPQAPGVSTLQGEDMEGRDSSQPPAESVLSAPANSAGILDPQTTDQILQLVFASDSINASHLVVEGPPTGLSFSSAADLGDVQDDRKSDCLSIGVDPTAEDSVSGYISGVHPLPAIVDREFEMPQVLASWASGRW